MFFVCAGAKRDSSQWGIFGDMDGTTIALRLTVQDVLDKWPQAFTAFVNNKTKCPGCFMQQFCTLKDVADTYGLPLEQLIDEIAMSLNQGI